MKNAIFGIDSMGQRPIQAITLLQPSNSLTYSSGCEALRKEAAYQWLFEFAHLFQDHPGECQDWSFKRVKDNVLVVCTTLEGKILVSRLVHIFDHIQSFQDTYLQIRHYHCTLQQELQQACA